MDSMSGDLIRGLETSLPTTFSSFVAVSIENAFMHLVSGDVDGAEEYLSDFTELDSNRYSNLMFYLVKRQRYFKSLVEGDNMEAGFTLFSSRPYGVMNISIPETEEFIGRDIRRIIDAGLMAVDKGKKNGYAFDILTVSNSFTDEMFTMMNQLIPMNPDLPKKEEDKISSQMHKLHLHDNKTTMIGVAGPAAIAFSGGEVNKDNDLRTLPS